VLVNGRVGSHVAFVASIAACGDSYMMQVGGI